MKIRLETPADYAAVENLTREAFWNVYRPGCLEHLLLHRLRSDPCFVPELDYVIEDHGTMIAQIAYATGTLTLTDGTRKKQLLFGPLGVLPEEQGKGYGAELVRFTLEKAQELGYLSVVIIGNPEYYHRFGFESASNYGIRYEGIEQTEEAPFFMVKALCEDALQQGVYADPPCYSVEDADAEAFDRRFPPKKKEKRPGQLV